MENCFLYYSCDILSYKNIKRSRPHTQRITLHNTMLHTYRVHIYWSFVTKRSSTLILQALRIIRVLKEQNIFTWEVTTRSIAHFLCNDNFCTQNLCQRIDVNDMRYVSVIGSVVWFMATFNGTIKLHLHEKSYGTSPFSHYSSSEMVI